MRCFFNSVSAVLPRRRSYGTWLRPRIATRARGRVLFLIRPHFVCKRANQPLENHVHVRAAGDVAAFANNELDPFTNISLDRALHLHKARLNHHHGFALVQRTYIKSPGPGARDIWDVTARAAPGPWPDVRLGVRPGVALRPGPRPPAPGLRRLA